MVYLLRILRISGAARRPFTWSVTFLLFMVSAVCGSAAAYDVTLVWEPPLTNADGTPLNDLAGYRVYYGTTSRGYSSATDVGRTTSSNIGGLFYGVAYYFAVTAYDASGNESQFSNEVTKTGALPTPTHAEIFSYPGVVAPLTGASPPGVRPVAVGEITRGTFCLQVGLPRYSGAVDIYLVVYAPDIDSSEVYFITSDRLLSPGSSGAPAWREGVIGEVRETVYCDIPTSAFPHGAYVLGLAVTPTGRFDSFHIWTTELVLN